MVYSPLNELNEIRQWQILIEDVTGDSATTKFGSNLCSSIFKPQTSNKSVVLYKSIAISAFGSRVALKQHVKEAVLSKITGSCSAAG